jgi:hypothetical protein
MDINDIIIEEQLNVIGPETENKTLSNLFRQRLQTPDDLWLTPEKVFAWFDQIESLDD